MFDFRHGVVRRGAVLCYAVCGLGAPSVAAAQTWSVHGPEGASITALAIAPWTPTTLSAGTRTGGIFKSTNGGARWQRSGPPRLSHQLPTTPNFH